MSQVLNKPRGVANTANNILFIYYSIQLFHSYSDQRKASTHTLCLTCSTSIASTSQYEQPYLAKHVPCPWQRDCTRWSLDPNHSMILWYFKSLVLNTFAERTSVPPEQRHLLSKTRKIVDGQNVLHIFMLYLTKSFTFCLHSGLQFNR